MKYNGSRAPTTHPSASTPSPPPLLLPMPTHIRLQCPPFAKVLVVTPMVVAVVMAALVFHTHCVGRASPFDLSSTHFSSLAPSSYVFGLWYLMYMRLVMLIVLELSSPDRVTNRFASVSHAAACAVHVAWLVAWAQELDEVVVVTAVVHAGLSLCTLLLVSFETRSIIHEDGVCQRPLPYTRVPASIGRQLSLVFSMAHTLTFHVWYAWSVLVAVLCIAAYPQRAKPDTRDEEPHSALVGLHALLLVCVAASSYVTLFRTHMHGYAIAVYTWVMASYFVRGFDGVAPIAHPFAVAYVVLCVVTLAALLTSLLHKARV